MAKDPIAHIRTERPPARVAAVATKRGLGDWTDTFATQQGFGWRKWRDSRLYFFTGGVAMSSPGVSVAAYDWGTVRVFQYRGNINGMAAEASSMLVDPDGKAVEIGVGGVPMSKADRKAVGITSWTKDAPYVGSRTWGDYIQQCVTRAQLQGTLTRIQSGEALNFGPYKISRQRISDSEHSSTWSEITEIGFTWGTFMFNGSERRSTTPNPVDAFKIPNLDLFVRLCHHLSPNATV